MCVCPPVHQVQLGTHCQGSISLGINGLGQLDGFGGSNVGIGWRHCQYDGVGVGDVGPAQIMSLLLDIIRLVPHWYLQHRYIRTYSTYVHMYLCASTAHIQHICISKAHMRYTCAYINSRHTSTAHMYTVHQ